MNTFLALAFLLLAAVSSAIAAVGRPFAAEVVTVSTTATGVTAGLCKIGETVNPALIMVKDQRVYFTLNSASATPTSNDYVGNPGDVIEVDYPELFRAIRADAVDAKLKVTCFSK